MAEPFAADRHYAAMADWYRGHHLQPLPREALPETGFVVPGVAAGFLYRGERGLAWVEGLISNPEARRRAHEALDAVVSALLQSARDSGVRLILSTTAQPAVAQRARQHGFKVERQFVLTRRVS